MNRVYLVPRALLSDPASLPRAREWHALHISPLAAVVVADWDEGTAEDAFDAQPGVIALPSLLEATSLPPAVASALATYGATDTDTTFGLLRRLRPVWPGARERF